MATFLTQGNNYCTTNSAKEHNEISFCSCDNKSDLIEYVREIERKVSIEIRRRLLDNLFTCDAFAYHFHTMWFNIASIRFSSKYLWKVHMCCMEGLYN